MSARTALAALGCSLVLGLSGCSLGGSATTPGPLPGLGRPTVTIGDKNATEQFVLGQLYAQALTARGYSVVVIRNIGVTPATTMQALASGKLSMYPEYLNVWNTSIAANATRYADAGGAYRAAQRFARAHALKLLAMTPFSDTVTIGTLGSFASAHRLQKLGDLRSVAASLTLGSPPQFTGSASGLPEIEQVYGFVPARVVPIDIGSQYQALQQGEIQATYASTTDAQLTSGGFRLLQDHRAVLGWGNVVPVVPASVLAAEGPAFARTINRVSRLLTLNVMRRLNAEVDLYNQDPTVVAKTFLQQHGLVPGVP